MQRLLASVCILLFCVSASPQGGHREAINTPGCDQWAPGSTEDLATVNFTFDHTPSLTPADKQRIRREIRSTVTPCEDFDEAVEETGERVRLVYQERGYFKAEVADPQFKVVRRNGRLEQIDVTISVEEGRQYRFKDMSFPGATVFSEEDLRRQFPINSGDIFDRSKISEGLENLRKLYVARGYINFTPVPDTMIDDDPDLISLKIDIDEGTLFHWGELMVNGVESQPGARQKLLAEWQAYRGTPYDGDITLKRLLRHFHTVPPVEPYEVFGLSRDERAGLVNVSITLVKPPTEVLRHLMAVRRRWSAGAR